MQYKAIMDPVRPKPALQCTAKHVSFSAISRNLVHLSSASLASMGNLFLGDSTTSRNCLQKNNASHAEAQWYACLGQYDTTLRDAQKGRSARPQRAKRRGVRFGTLSPLSDARTPLTDFFSIPLNELCAGPGEYPNGWFDPS